MQLAKSGRLVVGGMLMLLLAACGAPTQSSGFEVSVVNLDVAPAGAALIVQAGKPAPAALGDVRGPAVVVPCGTTATLTLASPPPKDAQFDMYVVPPGRRAGGGPLGDFSSGHIVVYLTTGGPFTKPEPMTSPPPFKCPNSG